MRKLVWALAFATLAAQGPASAAARANHVCPESSDQLARQLNSLAKTSEVDRSGLILRSHSGAGMKMLGATPVSVNSNWVEGQPVAAEFSLPDDWKKYAGAFRASFPEGQAKCDFECRWAADGAAAAGALKSATLSNELVVNTATVRCEYN